MALINPHIPHTHSRSPRQIFQSLTGVEHLRLAAYISTTLSLMAVASNGGVVWSTLLVIFVSVALATELNRRIGRR